MRNLKDPVHHGLNHLLRPDRVEKCWPRATYARSQSLHRELCRLRTRAESILVGGLPEVCIMRVLVWICLFSIAVFAAGFLYQWTGGWRDRLRFTRAGRWIKVGPRCKLYLHEQGAGGPTVLFESGIAATHLNWRGIQERIAEFTHTASYDRGGLGWSSRSQSARTPRNIAAELHGLLDEAGIKPPYILVGHSFGGLVMRQFALMFPREVLGVVLVDPMRLEEWPPLDASKQAVLDRGIRMSGYGVTIARFGLARLAVTDLLCRSGHLSSFLAGSAGKGGMQVLMRVKEEVNKMPCAVWPVVAAHWSKPGFYAGMSDHVESVPDTVREMLAAGPILDIPVLLLTPGKSQPLDAAGLSRIGDNVRQVIAWQSAHWIHLDEPRLVIDAIREVALAAETRSLAVSLP
jgi:pimeloyl-ACP methyl ester carboxylesterase